MGMINEIQSSGQIPNSASHCLVWKTKTDFCTEWSGQFGEGLYSTRTDFFSIKHFYTYPALKDVRTLLSQEHFPLPQDPIWPKHNCLPNPIVIHQKSFQPSQQREPIQFTNLIVREINCIELVQSGTQVLNNRDFIAWGESARQELDSAHRRAEQSKRQSV